eukprot:TRINITY_DN12026_c0_g2_i1.p2 TRINITY_DN12026_c0_g2~~TRINITY_DN12026_c0_g2_i1.p2  ORF type:complete len:100 (-),score=21.65 TRINITY_DN12026_c0_g2_i1:808-1107(-)
MEAHLLHNWTRLPCVLVITLTSCPRHLFPSLNLKYTLMTIPMTTTSLPLFSANHHLLTKSPVTSSVVPLPLTSTNFQPPPSRPHLISFTPALSPHFAEL